MKIALITIHNANNYGAVLQTYATKKVLSECGEVETINYDNKTLSKHLDLLRFKLSIHGIKMFIHDILRLKNRLQVVRKFKEFIVQNMNLTIKLTKKEIDEGKLINYDVYICGSDQIWNPEIVNADGDIDPIYFLSFSPNKSKKISYASSIGHYNYNDQESITVKALLKDFSLISTRENDGVTKLKNILPDNDIKQVLDPTLLLSKEEWTKSFNLIVNKNQEKYILIYTVPRSKLMIKAIEFYSKKYKIKIKIIDQMLKPIAKVDEHINNAGPKDFLELFLNASFIITDSFHGTCFSLNFGKPFISISAGKKTNRISSLLSLFNLTDRLVHDDEKFTNFDINKDIVQRDINYGIEEERQRSKNILLNAVLN